MSRPPDEVTVINPEMMTVARESRGLTQTAAAKELGVSQSRLSKMEGGLVPAASDLKDDLARVYHYPPRFFTLRDPILGPGTSEFFHRKRQATPVKALNKLHAELTIRMIHIARLLRAVEIEADTIPRIDPDEVGGTATDVARAAKAHWALPRGPIKSVTETIENAGGIVVVCDMGTPLVDAMSRYVPGLPRVFFVDGSAPADRQRMTLAHELGHAIMHHIPHKAMETEAFQFAAEFLMPTTDIRKHFDRVDVPQLASLKPYWKVSMAALLMRARDLNKVTERKERYLWSQMTSAGFKTREPAELDVAPEQPRLLREIIQVHQDELGYGAAELSELIALYDDEARELYDVKATRQEMRSRLRAIHTDRSA